MAIATPVQKVESEKDLGVNIDQNLQFSIHANSSSSKANKIIGLMFRSFSYMSPQMFLALYKSLIRPIVEYATPVSSPHLVRDMTVIENVQRRATKRIPCLKHLSYQDRLKSLSLPTLQYRRERADIIQTYKILNHLDILNVESLFDEIGRTSTRGHSRKLYKRQFRLGKSGHFFSNRVINIWNSLPEEVVCSPSLNTFKSRLNKVLEKTTQQNFNHLSDKIV
ncbi:uncharacterized protein [Argopecten irradians]|uniref:uncharacterized protein n=1 Tax=Argopecten irradians TaxID=31199 RepID=UPI00371F7D44